jgi:hypothetical protein
LHLADHSAAAAVDAISVAVEATIVAALRAVESLAAVMAVVAIESFKSFRSIEPFGPLAAVYRSIGRRPTVLSAVRCTVGPAVDGAVLPPVGVAIEAFSAIVSTVRTLVSFRAVFSNRAVVANGSLVSIATLDARGPVGSI